MSTLDPEAPPAAGNDASAPPAKRSGLPGPPLLTIAQIGGGALLLASTVIHFMLWADAGRALPVRLLFILAALAAALLAAGVFSFLNWRTLLAGAVFMGAAAAAQVVSSGTGTGYQGSLTAPYGTISLVVHIAGFLLLLSGVWLLRASPKGDKPKEASQRRSLGKKGGSTETMTEPTSVVPVPDPRTAQLIRWPADRPHPMSVATEAAPAPASVSIPLTGPIRWTSRMAREAVAAPPAAPLTPIAATGVANVPEAAPPPSAPVSEPTPSTGPDRWSSRMAPETVAAPAPEVAAAAGAVTPADPADATEAALPTEAVMPTEAADVPEAAEPSDPVSTAPLAETSPVEEPVEETQPSEPEELRAAFESIPVTVPQPYYGMLVREQAVLSRLQQAFGPDDPRTLTTRGVIAYYYVSAGEFRRGALIQKGVADDSARIHGPDHPHTLTAQDKYAQWRKLAKKHRRSKSPVPA